MVTSQNSSYARVLTLPLPFMVAIFSRILFNLFPISSHSFTPPPFLMSLAMISVYLLTRIRPRVLPPCPESWSSFRAEVHVGDSGARFAGCGGNRRLRLCGATVRSPKWRRRSCPVTGLHVVCFPWTFLPSAQCVPAWPVDGLRLKVLLPHCGWWWCWCPRDSGPAPGPASSARLCR